MELLDGIIEMTYNHLKDSPFDKNYIDGVNALANLMTARANFTNSLHLRKAGSSKDFNRIEDN